MAIPDFEQNIPAPFSLRTIRSTAGMGTAELASKIGVTEATYRIYEDGGRNIPLDTLRRLEEILRNTLTPSEHYLFSDWPDLSEAVSEIAREIPKQNPLIRFGISENGMLELIPGLPDENDDKTIEALREEILEPVKALEARYALTPNTPQAGLFGPLVSRYLSELSKEPRNINFAVLYARGARFYAARISANRGIESEDWPTLDPKESEAIDAICDLHGPLVMASAVGRRLVMDARQYEITLEEEKEEEAVIEKFGEILASTDGIFEPETAKALGDLTAAVTNDPQPSRSRYVRVLVVGSTLVCTVGLIAWASTGVGILAALFGGETVKKTKDFKSLTDVMAKQYDEAVERIDTALQPSVDDLISKVKRLVDSKRGVFDKVSSLRSEFLWAKKVLAHKQEAGQSNYNSIAPEPDGKLDNSEKHILIFGFRDFVHWKTFGRIFAHELSRRHLDLTDLTDTMAEDDGTEIGLCTKAELENYAFRALNRGLLSGGPSVVSIAGESLISLEEVDKLVGNDEIYVVFCANKREDLPLSKADIRLQLDPMRAIEAAKIFAENFRRHGTFHGG